MKRPIVTRSSENAAVLRTPCAPATDPVVIQQTIQDLYDTLDATDNGVGLSAPQIGVPLRIFVVNYHGFRDAFVNPEIIRVSENMGSSEEGCLSLPGVSVRVVRPKMVWVNRTSAAGAKFLNQKYKKLDARVIQHEMDHLNGVLITDYEPGQEYRVPFTNANT